MNLGMNTSDFGVEDPLRRFPGITNDIFQDKGAVIIQCSAQYDPLHCGEVFLKNGME